MGRLMTALNQLVDRGQHQVNALEDIAKQLATLNEQAALGMRLLAYGLETRQGLPDGGRGTESDTTPTCESIDASAGNDALTAQQRWRRKNRAKLAEYQRRYRARKRDERV